MRTFLLFLTFALLFPMALLSCIKRDSTPTGRDAVHVAQLCEDHDGVTKSFVSAERK